nr:MAG TPA: hydrolase [Bacteriophage sp.]
MANKPGEANFFPDVPVFPSMGIFQPIYGKFDLTTYIQGASDYEIMAFLVGKYNACLEAYGTVTKLSTDTVKACKQLQDWINSWFTNLDVQEEINKKLDKMIADGSFETLMHKAFDAQVNQQTTSAVTAWLVANVTPTGSAVVVDKSLSIEGAAADAKVVGDTTWRMKKINYIGTEVTDTVDLNKLDVNTQITFAYPANKLLNLPHIENLTDTFNGSVITLAGDKAVNNVVPAAGAIQMLFVKDSMQSVFVRTCWDYPSSWLDWRTIGGFANGKHFIYNEGDGNLSLDALVTNESYVVSYPVSHLIGLPPKVAAYGGTVLFTLQTFNYSTKQRSNAPDDGAIQFLTEIRDNTLWVRKVLGGDDKWSDWYGVGSFTDGKSYINNDGALEPLNLNSLPFNQACVISSDYSNLINAPTELAGLQVQGILLSFYYQNKKDENSDTAGGAIQILYSQTTPNVLYVRIGWSYPATWYEWHTVGSKSSEPIPTATTNYYAFSGLGNFTACGDSITASLAYPTSEAVQVQSWAKILAKLNGTSCNVFAQGGIDTKGYLESNLYTEAVADKAQFAILFLGINDINNSIPVGVSSDIGTTKNTYYANYSKIINGLLTNHKFVFCITLPTALQHSVTLYNNAIIDICNNHIDKAFYADITQYSDALEQFGHGHLSSVGYGELAGAIQNAIGNAMAANSYFKILDA